MGYTKNVAAFALVASQAYSAQADENNGWFAGLEYEQNVDAYTLTIPTSMLGDGPVLDYLPHFLSMNILSSNCTNAFAVHRWGGGNTDVGGLSWRFSASLKASSCHSDININFAPNQSYALARMNETAHSTILTLMETNMPPAILSLAGIYGVDIDNVTNISADAITALIMDPTRPLPTTENVTLAFSNVPAIPNPRVNAAINEAQNHALEVVNAANEAREIVDFVYSFPDQVDDNGRMFALGFETSLEARYHFARQSYFYAGADSEATVKASFHANPLPQLSDETNFIVPFYGIETTARLGVAFEDAIGNFDVAAGYNHPFSTFDIPLNDITLTGMDSPYLNLSLSDDSGFKIDTTYTPELKQAGFTVNFTF